MEKVLAIGATTVKLQAVSAPPTGAKDAARGDGALSCAVLIVELPGYAARAVAEQLLSRQRLNGHVAVALEGVPANQRIVLDTGAGIAITFLEHPLSALEVLCALLANIARGNEAQHGMTLHGALNLGPVRVIAESNAHVNILGDGVSVAQRLLAFAKPGQILVAKTYVEGALAQNAALASLFVYQGSRTDAHVRDHELFELDAIALTSPLAKAQDASEHAPAAPASARSNGKSRTLAFAFAGLSLITLTAMVVHILEREIPAIQLASTPAKSALRVVTTPLRAVSRVEPLTSRTIEASPERTDTASDRTVASADTAGMASAAASPTQPVASQAPPAVAAQTPIDSRIPVQQRVPIATAKPVAVHANASAQPTQRRKPAANLDAQRAAPVTQHAAVSPSAPPRDNAPLAAWQPVESGAPSAAPMPGQANKVAGAASALVTLAISPWGEVFVDGQSMGVSPPLREFELPIGKHRVVVRNGDFKAYEQDLDLTSNQTVKVKHKFAQRS